MATKINLTLALPADEYNLLKAVSDDTGISRSDLVSSLISQYLPWLKDKLAAGTTQTPEALPGAFEPEPGISTTQKHDYDFFTKTDRLILGGDPDTTGDDPDDDVRYEPIED